MAYQYTPAFVAFCKGAPLEEIAVLFDIPLESLKAKVRQEGWTSLANALCGQFAPMSAHTADALARIEENRTKNYETAAKLRDHLDTILDKLRAGTLRITKRFQYKGQIVECEAEPSIGDMLNIGQYARTVHDLTYRALGDQASNGGHKPDAVAAAPRPPAPITIVLPAAIALPREKRAKLAEPRQLPYCNEEPPSANN